MKMTICIQFKNVTCKIDKESLTEKKQILNHNYKGTSTKLCLKTTLKTDMT